MIMSIFVTMLHLYLYIAYNILYYIHHPYGTSDHTLQGM